MIKLFSLKSYKVIIGTVVEEHTDHIIIDNPMEIIEEKNGSYLLIRYLGFSTGKMKVDRSVIECETAGNEAITKRYMTNIGRIEIIDRLNEFNNKFTFYPSHENYTLH